MNIPMKILIYFTAFWRVVFTTTECQLKDIVDGCVYTVTCVGHAGSAVNPACDYRTPYVTFEIKNSLVDTITAGFFGATNFDSRVRKIQVKDCSWKNLEEAAFRYYTKTEIIDFSNIDIQVIKNYAFKNLVNLQNLDLSMNKIRSISVGSLMIAENRVSEMKFLNLSYNLINDITPESFKYLENLQELDLRHNRIQYLADNIFGDLKQLTYLNLQDNSIISLNMTLVNLKSLKTLDLSFNKIESVAGYELNRLSALENLNMSYNFIKTVESNCFNQAFGLQVIDFSNNRIQSELENVIFINNAQLRYVNFKNNNITKMQENVFKHNAIKYIYLEGNNINATITKSLFAGLDNVTYLDLSNQCFGDIKDDALSGLKNILHLNLSGNQINTIDNSSFQSTKSLSVLDISFNNITDIDFFQNSLPNVTEVFLKNNSISSIKSGLFTNQTLLKKLDISMNKIINIEPASLPLQSLQYFNVSNNNLNGSITNGIFSSAKLLRFLDLSGHNITKIQKQAFVDMPVLTRLNLSHNQIDFIDPDNFQSVNNMYSLDISFNKIVKFNLNSSSLASLKAVYVNNNLLEDIPDIELSEILYYDLSNNQIESLNNPILQIFKKLRVLRLSNNRIKNFNNVFTNILKNLTDISVSSNYITSIDLSYYKDLVSLDISNNLLNSINSTFFDNLEHLQALDISNNNITKLLPGTFQNLKILKLLNISSNKISDIRYGSLKGLHRTEVLDLSRNALSDVDVHVFHECEELIKLVLDYNLIKELDIEKLIVIIPTLKFVSIGGNPIKCKEIVRSIKNVNMTASRHVEVTSIHKIFHEDNVYGIKCGDKNYSETYEQTVKVEDSGNVSSSPIVLTLVILLIVIVLIGIAVFIYQTKFKSNEQFNESRLQMRQSIDLNGSEFGGDLLN